MKITYKITLDMARCGIAPRIDVVQGDTNTRELKISLYDNSIAWPIPKDATAVIRYKKPDGTGGNYAILPDGTEAYRIDGNVLIVALAPQVCTAPGLVLLAVGLYHGAAEINTFSVNIDVHPNPGIDVISEDYSNLDLDNRLAKIETEKVSVADIIDNLTTNVTNKPLSAAQGVALKALIDAITIQGALPNPNALTFTGAVDAVYDGSEPVTLEVPSINDSAVGALANAGEFGTLEDADAFIASALSDMDMPSIRRWACIYDFDAAYLTIFASPNGNAGPDCIVKLDLGLKYAIKRGYSDGYLTDIIWDPWTWCDLTTNAPDEYASGIWHVRSWNNGAVELWGTVVADLTFTSWGNIYAAQNAFAAQAYPVTFAEAPVVTATLLPGGESSIYGYGLITGETAGTVSATPSFGVIRATAQSAAQSVRLSLYVKGTLAT